VRDLSQRRHLTSAAASRESQRVLPEKRSVHRDGMAAWFGLHLTTRGEHVARAARAQVVRRLSQERGLRLTHVLLELALALIGACSGPSVEPVFTPPTGWSPGSATIPATPSDGMRQWTSELNSYGLLRSFWPAAEASVAELEARGLQVFDGPCGPTVAAWVKALPQDHPVITTETAVELDARGEVVSEWPLTLNGVVAGIDGDRLLVPFRFWPDRSTPIPALAITSSGALSIVAVVPQLDTETFPCPSITAFGNSAYLRCMILVDRSSNAERRIAYQLPCT
jgi:hypothetical protein